MSLAPILLYPAFRYGAATPWGGDQLKTRYGKPTPDTRTGESLEMSVIPGLNSTDAQGTPLSEPLWRAADRHADNRRVSAAAKAPGRQASAERAGASGRCLRPGA